MRVLADRSLEAVVTATVLLVVGGGAQGDVTLTNRQSQMHFDVLAEAGVGVDRLIETPGTSSLTEALVESFEYDAFVLNEAGSARASGSADRDEVLVYDESGLVQVQSSVANSGEAEYLSGTGGAAVLISHTLRLDFVVDAPTEMSLEGLFFPGSEYAEVRLRRVGDLFDTFWVSTFFNDSGPYAFQAVLEPSSYWIEVDMLLFVGRQPQSDPPLETETTSYEMTLTFGDGPPTCAEDLDASGAVDFGDILAILSAWGNAGGPEDLDGSGTVDFGDILRVLAAWGACP